MIINGSVLSETPKVQPTNRFRTSATNKAIKLNQSRPHQVSALLKEIRKPAEIELIQDNLKQVLISESVRGDRYAISSVN